MRKDFIMTSDAPFEKSRTGRERSRLIMVSALALLVALLGTNLRDGAHAADTVKAQKVPPGTYAKLPKSLKDIPPPKKIRVTPPAKKPAKTIAHKGLYDDHVVIKFANGLPVSVKKQGDGFAFGFRKGRGQVSASDRKRFDRLKVSEKDAANQLRAIGKISEIGRAVEIKPLFTANAGALDRQRAQGESKGRQELADLTNYYLVRLRKADPARAASLADQLNRFRIVELAYLPPRPAPNPDLPPATPNYTIGQTMLLPSPNGLNFTYARRFRGGAGRGVTVVDIERDWRNRHEDVQAPVFSLGAHSANPDDLNHGTAVACVLVGKSDRAGVTGGAYEARFGFSSPGTGGPTNVANAINNAALRLDFGDVILIEQQFWGPNSCCGTPVGCGCVPGGRGQVGMLPVESFPAEFDAIRTAVTDSITVVEAAGNGGQNLDLPLYRGIFNRAVRDSGAILVGAADQRRRTPLAFSNFGTRVDSYASGNNVVSCGYGDLAVTGTTRDTLQHYTRGFSGTSSASAIVAAAVTVTQGVMGQLRLEPLRLRQLMTLTGARPSDFASPNPRLIGTKPDLRRLLNLATQ